MSASTNSFSTLSDRPVLAERRSKYRYPLVDLRVHFRASGAGSTFSGAGQVLNISSGGILVASEHKIIEGARVDMRIEWPSLLDGKIPLQFLAVGRILRRGTSDFAASFERYQFRTMRSSIQPKSRLGGDVIKWPPKEPDCAADGLMNLNLE